MRHYLAQASPFECQGHGACLLFDIVDSTGMKARHPDWKRRFVYFYEAFTSLVDSLAAEPVMEDRIVHKFLGDAAFAYLPVSLDDDRAVVAPDARLLSRILDRSRRFVAFFEENAEALDIRLRTVLAYVTHIQLVRIPSGTGAGFDALGQGVDFTFRLEKYSSVDGLCMNAMFFGALAEAGTLGGWRLERCAGSVKGWVEPQRFYRAAWPR